MVREVGHRAFERELAAKIIKAWQRLGDHELGGHTLEELMQHIALYDQYDDLENQYDDMLRATRNNKIDERLIIWQIIWEARRGVSVKYGLNSNAYDEFGGTPLDKRGSGLTRVKKKDATAKETAKDSTETPKSTDDAAKDGADTAKDG